MSALIELQRELRPVIEERLKAFVSTMEFGLSTELRDMLSYHMGWDAITAENASGGKRIRPLLTLLCHGAFDDDLEPALPAAMAVETAAQLHPDP